jgi:hypothetical protein
MHIQRLPSNVARAPGPGKRPFALKLCQRGRKSLAPGGTDENANCLAFMTSHKQRDSILAHLGEALGNATRSTTAEPLPPLMLALLRLLQQKEQRLERNDETPRRHRRKMH